MTATATIRVEAPVGEQAADGQEEVGEHPYDFSKALNKIIQNMSKNNVPEVFLPNSLPDVLPNINTPTLPKLCHGCDVDCS